MALINVKEKNLINNTRKIYKYPDHYVNVTGLIKVSALTDAIFTDEENRKYVPQGTCLKGGLSVSGRQSLTVATTDFDCVVVNSEYVRPGDTEVLVTVCIHGFLRKQVLAAANFKESMNCSNSMLAIM